MTKHIIPVAFIRIVLQKQLTHPSVIPSESRSSLMWLNGIFVPPVTNKLFWLHPNRLWLHRLLFQTAETHQMGQWMVKKNNVNWYNTLSEIICADISHMWLQWMTCIFFPVTSSSLYVIMVKALKTQSVEPVMVMILSGQEPSEMLTRALLCGVS